MRMKSQIATAIVFATRLFQYALHTTRMILYIGRHVIHGVISNDPYRVIDTVMTTYLTHGIVAPLLFVPSLTWSFRLTFDTIWYMTNIIAVLTWIANYCSCCCCRRIRSVMECWNVSRSGTRRCCMWRTRATTGWDCNITFVITDHIGLIRQRYRFN